jgi:hypothetical protein
MSKRQTPRGPEPAGDSLTERFRIERYGGRNWALYDADELVAVTLYKKGAVSVQERLEAAATAIDDLQRRIEDLQALRPLFRKQATPAPRLPQQLALLAAEGMGAYRITSPRRPAPRR